jgi:hypothetical protein
VNPIFHFKAPALTVRGIAIKLRLACRDEDDSAVLAVLGLGAIAALAMAALQVFP